MNNTFNQNNKRKNFIPINEAFLCDNCGKKVNPAKGTFRNHCPYCLTSKHVDQEIPGDRLCKCQGLMPVINYDGTDPDKLILQQQCVLCGKINRNRIAPDDNKEILFKTNP